MMSESLKGGFSSFSSGTTGTTPALFGNSTPAAGATAGTTGAPSAFGASGGNFFTPFGAKPVATAPPLGGGANGATAATAGGTHLFGGTGGPQASAAPATNTSAAPSSAFGLSGAKPAEQSTNAGVPGTSATPKPTGESFRSASAAPQSTSTAGPAASTFFAAPPKQAEASSSTPAPAPTSAPLFSGIFFGKKPDAPAAPTAPAAPSLLAGFGAKKDDGAAKDGDKGVTSAAPTGGLFGQPAANKDTPAAATGSAFGLFGQKSTEKKDSSPAPTKEGEKKDGAAAPESSAFGSTTTGNALASTIGTSTSSTAAVVSVPPPSMLRGKTIEEIVNKWSSELEMHVQEFNRLAAEVSVWDRALIDNGNTIAALFQHVLLAEREQSDIEQSLKHVEDQQKELSATLEVYEKAAGEIFEGQGGGLRALDVGPADAERDKHYTLAADLNANLDDLSRSLMQVIDSVNSISESSEDAVGSDDDGGKPKGDAPLEQIAQILSSHLESLQWIDGAVREVDSKVADVERRVREATSAGSRGSGPVNSLAGSMGGVNGTSRSRGFGLR